MHAPKTRPASLALALALALALGVAAVPAAAVADDASAGTTSAQEQGQEPAAGSTGSTASDDPVTGDDPAGDDDPAGVDDPATGDEGGEPSATGGEEAPAQAPTASVAVHMQNRGWLDAVSGGGAAGVAGGGLRLEALRLSVSGDAAIGGGIEYRSHVQNVGWQSWSRDGALSGTSGRSLRVEALQIRLHGELAEAYDVYYTTYVEGVGWMAWAKNGESSGSGGLGRRVEALRVVLVERGGAAPDAMEGACSIAYLPNVSLAYATHVQSIGWTGYSGQGATSGTTGRSLRVEALRVHYSTSEVSGSVRYQTHVQNRGWGEWKSADAVSGTTGQSLRVEAVRLELTGDMASCYDIYYRVHVANVGWTAWASNGADCGSTGLSMRCEAIQVQLVPKGTAAPSESGAAVSTALLTAPTLLLDANVDGSGWQGERAAGQVVGTTGQSRHILGLSARLQATETSVPGGITYRAHCSSVGWRAWASDGADAAVGSRVECVQLKLTGKAASVYDVYYRVHVSNVGWMGWAKNGESAGTTGLSRGVEAVDVRLVPKGGAAPGSTANHYLDKTSYYDAATRKAQGIASATNWLILVNLSEHRIYVFSGSRNNWTKRQTFVCSSGASSTPTVTGTFRVGSRGYSFGSGYTCYYWTQFYGNYLFHSILYNQGTRVVQDGRLGMNISHGCLRMPIDQAKWIYDNIPSNTTVVVYR